jgi:hypothetical protein
MKDRGEAEERRNERMRRKGMAEWRGKELT